MDAPLDVPVVLGSIRSVRRSFRPAQLIVERIAARGHRGELVDLRELDLPLHGRDGAEEHPAVVLFQERMARADAVVFFTPEYNHSFSAPIKNVVDFLHAELRRKAVAVCGLSSGALGGVRAVEQLKQVLVELHAVPIRGSVHFTHAREMYDEAGTLVRGEFVHRIDDMVDELAWYGRALKWGRENLPVPERRR